MTTNVPAVPNEEGNTISSSPSFWWCFTYNNYQEEDEKEDCVPKFYLSLIDFCSEIYFQEEKGKSGTQHLQGTIKTVPKKRFKWLKERFPKLHWEKCHHPKDSIAYCTKAETRNGRIFTYPPPDDDDILEPIYD